MRREPLAREICVTPAEKLGPSRASARDPFFAVAPEDGAAARGTAIAGL
jgi:hypothetical protein